MNRIYLIIALSWFSSSVSADLLRVAVSGNLAGAIKEINQRFELASGHKASTSIGSTSQLATQLLHGAPFDVLLAANEREPLRVMRERGLALSHYAVYAQGRLVLYTRHTEDRDIWSQFQKSSSRFVMANPKLAPYGLAAQQVLQHHDLFEQVSPRLIKAENIAQAFQYVISGQTEFGFVGLSQAVLMSGDAFDYYILPDHWYQPILQGMLRLNAKPVSVSYMNFILSSEIQRLLQNKYGYGAVKE